MKEGWEYKKLGDVAIIINGFAFKSSLFTKEGEKILRISNIQNDIVDLSDVVFFNKETYKQNLDKYKVYPDDILIALSGATTGKIGINKTNETLYLNQRVAICRESVKTLNHKYLYCFLKTKSLEFLKDAEGVAQPNLSTEQMKNYVLPIPPLSEQQHIVEELDLLSSIIEKKKAQLNELDNLAQSLFYEMFSDINAYTPISTYVESVGGGKSLAGNEECENKVLKTGAVTYDHFNGTEVKNLPIDYTPQQEHLVKDGDILVSRMNTLEYVGACAYVWKAPKNTYLPDRLWRVKPKEDINSIFLWFSLIQSESKEQIRTMASGTSGTMKNISRPRFLSVKIKKAPLELQNRFASKIEAIEHQKELIKQSIKEVETLFNSRMDFYFN